MWKKQLLYCVLIVGLLRLGWTLYSTMNYPVFSQGNSRTYTYTALPEQYEQELKKAIEKDIDNIMDDTCVNSSELDMYIGLLLRDKEKKYPGFTKRNNDAIELLRTAVIDYVRMYTTLLHQKNSDVNPKASKREIQSCIRTSGYKTIKPLLDDLMYSENNGD